MHIHCDSPDILAPSLPNSSQPLEKVGVAVENRASLFAYRDAVEGDHEGVFGVVEREDFAPKSAADAGEGWLLLD